MTETPKPEYDSEEFGNLITEYCRKHGTPSAIQVEEMFSRMTKDVYQRLLETEMDEHLGYPKHAHEGDNTGNSRNGKTKKKVRGEHGEIEISTPRDRNGDFDPKIIGKRQTTLNKFSDIIISLYARGMTTREIGEHIKELYQVEVSAEFISRATEVVREEIVAWQSRPLEPLYPVVYMDGIRFNVRHENRIKKKVIYIALGVDIAGKQDVLGLWCAENEGAQFWLSVCQDLNARGVNDILIACVDGLQGLPEAIESVFPLVDVQLCIVHQIRNSTKFISYKDRKAFCTDLKTVYGATTVDAAELALNLLEEKWTSKYPGSVKSWRTNWGRLTAFFKYPMELRTIIYTTNSIESLNSVLRKNTSSRKVFPSDDAVMKILYLNIMNFTKKWKLRQNWGIVMNQLSILFHDRLNKVEQI
jgi:transposase-like protein